MNIRKSRSLAPRLRANVFSGRGRSKARSLLLAATVIPLSLGLVSPSTAATPAPAAAPTEELHFISRPDLTPPVVRITQPPEGTAPGSIFLDPAGHAAGPTPSTGPTDFGVASNSGGPMIMDNEGQPIWFKPAPERQNTDFRAQIYQGKPVLTWWEGTAHVPPGLGEGEYVIMDNTYHEIARVRPANGMVGDLHDFQITPQNTALMTTYRVVPYDLSPIGGPTDGKVYDSTVQEMDIATGKVLHEWHALDHVGLQETTGKPPQDPNVPMDYFHLNSVGLDRDGNLLISGRHTNTVYDVDRETGEINWRLGGELSDFKMGPGAGFVGQHDARQLPDGTISLFDNHVGGQGSRALLLSLDTNAMTANLKQDYTHPQAVTAGSQGNAQVLPNGNVFTGWGSQPFFTEFAADGGVAMQGYLGKGVSSYRAFRLPWAGHPTDPPAVAPVTESDGTLSVYASWNGSTDTTGWRLLAGDDPNDLQAVTDIPRDGFETGFHQIDQAGYVQVQALNADGQVIGTSAAVPTQT